MFVTANYKLSFDALREANVSNAWVMVLDTHGINVWCAAGKGTFSTAELVRMIEKCQLESLVNHKRLIVPQLGAVGVSGHQVKKMTGYDVVFGPVRADDLCQFIENDYEATSEMRTVTFNLADRSLLTPLECLQSLRYSLVVSALIFTIGILGAYSLSEFDALMPHLTMILLTSVMGAVVFPLLYPVLKGTWFTIKAMSLSLAWISIAALVFMKAGIGGFESLGVTLMGAALLESHALNFTGATPVSSYNETKKETLKMLPYLIAVFILGIVTYTLAVGQVIG